MDDIVREFVVESHENLDQLDQDLVALEDQPGSRELLGSVFRTIHTIKGTSGFLAFGVLESLTHVGENLLAELRDGKRPMTPRTTDVLLKMVDAVREILRSIESSGTEGGADWSSVVADIQSVLDDPTGAPLASPKPAPAASAAQESEAAAPTKAAPKRKIVAKPRAKAPAKAAAKTPEKAAAKPRAKAPAKPRATRPSTTRKAIAAEPMTSPSVSAPIDPEQTLEVIEPELVEAMDNATSDAPTQSRTDDAPVRSAADASIRVDVDVLDALMRHVGELVLARNAMTRLSADIGDAALVRASQRLSLIATELQQGVMKTRMQPIEHVWSKVPRMVRDISASLGRHVRLEMIGQDTELDRGLLEAIKDPLTHLIRNAIDHGIESPEGRKEAGKADQGVLTLRAFHQGGQVVVEISDDGKGIDPQVISAKAVERGLRTQAQVAAMGTQDILQLLFLPGFSTAEVVTNVSGRGVGMDVVRTKVEAIGGVVDVQSTPGLGTTWRLRIPLTLAIMPALTVECAGETYAVPQVNLLELLAVDDKQSGVEYVGDAAVYRLRGQLLPMVDLRDVLGRTPRESLVGAVIAVLQADGGRFGLVVDQVLNTEEIVAKPIGAAVKAIGLYAGATLLGDGSVSLILDIPAVARKALDIDLQDAVRAATTEHTASVQKESMLIVSVGEGRQVAMPLGAVTRLERLPASVIEQVSGSSVMQYRGKITPVADLAQLLGDGGTMREEFAVIVCTRGERTVALVANEVVDIVDCDKVDFSDVSGYGLLGSIVVKDRVTELLDLRGAVEAIDSGFYDDHEAELVGAGMES
ncbi:chemotaxis protein CheW [Demequina sp. TTPB684]|uniref:chemotaxis protein CheW n=1 Tax=unclassified Demequina TaxID=2620311 RepID=UPI001CF4AC09|nr:MULTISPECIES: chemotaxis protein CheW [unclassified Demequina]MCB2412900.1 chemotaxis protein CheW [Demequina sp. TTPB684]UPU87875.1 chemotaxis protein CheW [Demequina sp. TMPB413]